jgi:hypothetical protein
VNEGDEVFMMQMTPFKHRAEIQPILADDGSVAKLKSPFSMMGRLEKLEQSRWSDNKEIEKGLACMFRVSKTFFSDCRLPDRKNNVKPTGGYLKQ